MVAQGKSWCGEAWRVAALQCRMGSWAARPGRGSSDGRGAGLLDVGCTQWPCLHLSSMPAAPLPCIACAHPPQLVATMLYLDSENKKDMNLYINCSGGEVRTRWQFLTGGGHFRQVRAHTFGWQLSTGSERLGWWHRLHAT